MFGNLKDYFASRRVPISGLHLLSRPACVFSGPDLVTLGVPANAVLPDDTSFNY